MPFLSASALAGWGAEWDVGVLLPPLQCLRRCWCLPAPALLQRPFQQPVLGFVPQHLCCFLTTVVCAEVMASAPSPAANTQLWGSTGELLHQHIQGRCLFWVDMKCPPTKDKLCAKAGSDRQHVLHKTILASFLFSFHSMYFTFPQRGLTTALTRKREYLDVVAPASVERGPRVP